jgi:hypothetical protein
MPTTNIPADFVSTEDLTTIVAKTAKHLAATSKRTSRTVIQLTASYTDERAALIAAMRRESRSGSRGFRQTRNALIDAAVRLRSAAEDLERLIESTVDQI